ncbi:MAG: hypothetical protein ABI927_08550 [Gaiellaceae bacterium]
MIVTFDPETWNDQWIVRDYLPEVVTYTAGSFPSIAQLLGVLPAATA